jgi:CBS domain containing-hemolysin-like protein
MGKLILGLILVLIGIVLGLWLGVWVCFIGGIVQIFEAIKHSPIIPLDIAIGIAKILGASLVGWLSAIFPIGIGLAILDRIIRLG